MKYVYNYDKNTGEFLNATPAQLDPAETELQGKDVFLLPANATFIEPPIAVDGKIQVFKKEKWSMKTDMRGTTYFTKNGDRVIINKLGKRIPQGCAKNAPPDHLKRPKLVNSVWTESALVYEGHVVSTSARVKELTRKKITELGEDKAKTLKIIAGNNYCEEWEIFLVKRDEILRDSENFIRDNNLE